MFAAIIALLLLAASVGVIYVLLKNMGEDGIEVAAPTSCKSGQCGVRKGGACGQEDPGVPVELVLAEGEEAPPNEAGQPAQPQRHTG